jgi:hypothetical protein
MATTRIVVGEHNAQNKKIAKPLIRLIISYQKELQMEENKKSKPKKISFIYASLVLSREVRK